jgi:hypothetical protein
MATYLMFGTLTQEARRAASAKRTGDALALIEKYGGEFKAGYARCSARSILWSFTTCPEPAIQVSVDLLRTESALSAPCQ